MKGLAEINRVPLVACVVVSTSWGCWLPINVDFIPRYLNKSVFFIWGTINVSDISEDTIFIRLVIGVSIRKNYSSGVKSYCRTNIAHLLISTLPPNVKRRCFHVWEVYGSLFIMLSKSLSIKSFVYCLVSSTLPKIWFDVFIYLSMLLISYRTYLSWRTWNMDTILNSQYVHDAPEPCKVPWLLTSSVFE